MVNQAEDLIRETFQKLGDTLGIQIDIPDEMIANLAATLQTEIDRLEAAVEDESFIFLNELARAFRSGESNPRPSHFPVLEGIRAVLTHLRSVGRLIAADGMALTAEQVENVRAAREGLRGYRNFTGYGRHHVNQLIAAVDALFPATEPAEEVTQAEGFCSFCGWSRDACARGKGDCAPAEPAEEETKAEHNASVARREALGRMAQQLYEQSFDGCDGTFYHDFGRALEDFLPSQGWTRIPASSPVVPAPTETGPWQTWEAVPDGVWYVSRDDVNATHYVNRDGLRYRGFDGAKSKNSDCEMSRLAPFVAAAEEG